MIAELNACAVDDPLVLDAMEELEAGLKEENEGGKATWAECCTSLFYFGLFGNNLGLCFSQFRLEICSGNELETG